TTLEISQRVTFVGFVPDQQLPDYYRLCDLFVMPNREQSNDLEGFGITFLEANATAKPVIGGRSGGTADSISHGVSGELIDETNLQELVHTIRGFLLNSEKTKSMGKAGRMRAENEFGWKIRAQKLRNIARNVAFHHSSPKFSFETTKESA